VYFKSGFIFFKFLWNEMTLDMIPVPWHPRSGQLSLLPNWITNEYLAIAAVLGTDKDRDL
jgi:hypothetical protein